MKKNSKKKGFTLIELIVVIAIIGILAAIAIPRLANIQNNSKLKADQATADQIIKVARMVEADNNLSMADVVTSYPGSGDWQVPATTGTIYMNVPVHPQIDSTSSFGLEVNATDSSKYDVTFGGHTYVEP